MSDSQRTALQIQLDVLYALIHREMKGRLGRSRVGFFWALLEPGAHVFVPVVMYTVIFHRTLPGLDYPVFILFGLLPYLLFKNACLQTMDAVNSSPGVLAYRQVQLMDVFVARLVAAVLMECLLLSLLMIGLAIAGYDIVPVYPVELVLTLFLAVSLGFGLGLVFAAIVSLIPDARSIIKLSFVAVYFSSGVFFPMSRFPADVVDMLAWNPMVHILDVARWAGIDHYHRIPQSNITYPIAVSMVTLFVGLSLYRLRIVNKVTV